MNPEDGEQCQKRGDFHGSFGLEIHRLRPGLPELRLHGPETESLATRQLQRISDDKATQFETYLPRSKSK
jgi:hypothetical protein